VFGEMENLLDGGARGSSVPCAGLYHYLVTTG
jgi:hypothetical protein